MDLPKRKKKKKVSFPILINCQDNCFTNFCTGAKMDSII